MSREDLYKLDAYTKLALDDVKELLVDYKFGEILEIKQLHGGLSNSNYAISTSSGKYLLKICDNKTPEELDPQVGVLCRLQLGKFPAAYPVPSSTGTYIGTRKGTEKSVPFIVYDLLPGSHPHEATSDVLSQLAVAQARMHLTPLSELPASLPIFPMGYQDMELSLSKEMAGRAELKDPFIVALIENLPVFRQLHRSKLPEGLMHGDLFLENCMFYNGQLMGLIDFEECCQGPLLLDVTMTILGCCYNDQDQLDLQSAADFLAEYQTVRPLTSAELRLLGDMLAYACYSIGFWRFRQFNVRAPNASRATTHVSMWNRARAAKDNAAQLLQVLCL